MLRCVLIRLSGVLGLLSLACTQSFGSLYIVPSAYTSSEGNSSDNAPLGAEEQHFQQVFSSSLLTDIPEGSQIVGLAFRVNGGESALPAQTVPTFEIRLSESLNAPGSLSSLFADNRGPDEVLVRSGSLTITAGQFPGGTTPNNFGIIPFDTPYEYNGGNLLIEVAYQGFTSGRNADAVYTYNGSLAQTAFGTGYDATTATAGLYNEAIVFGFDVEPITPVPEPVATGLIGLAVMAAGATATHIHIRRNAAQAAKGRQARA